MKKAFLLTILLIISVRNICFANTPISREMNIKTGHSYLIGFTEEVIRISVGDTKAIDTELLTNIFNSKKELILKPKVKGFTNILIWTKSNVYNFDLNINQQTSLPKSTDNTTPAIQYFSKNNEKLSNEEKAQMDDLDLDSPPLLPDIKKDTYDFELDKPPMLKD